MPEHLPPPPPATLRHGRTATATAAAVAAAVGGGPRGEPEVVGRIPGGPHLPEGQPRTLHREPRLSEARAAAQQRVEPQRHSRNGGEEEDDRVAGVGEERDGVVRAARHALHERRREERREARLRVAVGLVRAMVRARVAVGSCTASHATPTCVGTQRPELRT